MYDTGGGPNGTHDRGIPGNIARSWQAWPWDGAYTGGTVRCRARRTDDVDPHGGM